MKNDRKSILKTFNAVKNIPPPQKEVLRKSYSTKQRELNLLFKRIYGFAPVLMLFLWIVYIAVFLIVSLCNNSNDISTIWKIISSLSPISIGLITLVGYVTKYIFSNDLLSKK